MTDNPLGIVEVELDLSRAIILERTDETPNPAYCVHGHVQCYSCNKWCLLGRNTLAEVQAGTTPICMNCATWKYGDKLGEPIQTLEDGYGDHD